ncbi:MAG: hypothetical protein OEO77_04720 [Acidimicrobiia bacterium]|nr:hypothetical protein [Acidimicrobiia bacterium]
MRRIVTTLALAGLMTLGAGPAFAHSAPPCNDTNGDGMPSGREYAKHHIVPLAHDGALGNEGHKPGADRGFSFCL